MIISDREGKIILINAQTEKLFGYAREELLEMEKGAYTGALTKQMGRFEVADGATLFLDEIGELSLELQGKLLRVLQEGEFERLGSPKTIKVDVRVIAATNRDLTEAIRNGNFREDLYYRLNVFPITVPPLRERLEDIPPLVWAFIKEFGEKMGKKNPTVQKRTMEALQHYPWPGNIRELRNVIEHAVIVSTGRVLQVRLPQNGHGVSARILTLDESERQHITEILEMTNWRIKGQKGAAMLLGLEPSTLYGKMKKLGIPNREKKRRNTDLKTIFKPFCVFSYFLLKFI
ncbi:MAG: sigma 54-interacting transcriptional regulator [bacterium]